MAIDFDWLPWLSYHGLTAERLTIVGNLLRQARDSAVDDHRPDMFEGGLSLGMSGWERSKGNICSAVMQYPWLSIANGGGMGATHFIFQIAGLNCRFYHGQPDDPPSRYRAITFEERNTLGLTPAGEHIPEGHALRFSVVTGGNLRTEEVQLIEYLEAEHRTVRAYNIPLDLAMPISQSPVAAPSLQSPPANVAIFAPPAPGVTLDPPAVGLAAADEAIEQQQAPGDGTVGE